MSIQALRLGIMAVTSRRVQRTYFTLVLLNTLAVTFIWGINSLLLFEAVDYSGKRPHLVDPQTGEEIAVELFVGVLGASGLIYAEATRGQDLPSWIGAHVGMLEYFQGSRGDLGPRQFEERRHDGQPLRAGDQPHLRRARPPLWRGRDSRARRDGQRTNPKSRSVSRSRSAGSSRRLRHRTFFTLADLNAAIRDRVDAINDRPMKTTGVSRRALFEQLDRPALTPLPAHALRAGGMEAVSVNIDYHVEVDHNFYSVPYQLVRARVEARFTASTVEVFFKGRRVASHVRLTGRGRFSTQVAHMPRGPIARTRSGRRRG